MEHVEEGLEEACVCSLGLGLGLGFGQAGGCLLEKPALSQDILPKRFDPLKNRTVRYFLSCHHPRSRSGVAWPGLLSEVSSGRPSS